MEVQGGTQQTLYGLNVEEEYEVHVRCKMKAFTKFGRYSDSIFIQLTDFPVRGEMSAAPHGHSPRPLRPKSAGVVDKQRAGRERGGEGK